MDTIYILLFWALTGSVFSLIGGLLLIKLASSRKQFISYALPFGAGALLAAAFFDLLPEALALSDPSTILKFALFGFLGFFVLERLLGWFHHHHHDDHSHGAKNRTHTTLVVVGDTVHNAIDGIALGAAFLVSVPTGIITSIAVAAHEIPQEVGDFGILLGKGMKPRRVIIVNLISALATVVTALATYWLGGSMTIPLDLILAITAGMFIYIAASDIIPDIHEKPHNQANMQSIMLIIGIVVVAVAIKLAEG